jgi:CubicO group peptidase (beta-lactamase class C family)
MYHTGSDILGVLIARVSGMDLGVFFKQRIFAPLGMKDTGFHAAPRQSPRLGGGYSRAAIPGHFDIIDPAAGGAWSRPPVFESGGGGLLSTADDYLLFARMLLDMGRSVSGERILSRAAVSLMTADHLTDAQKAASPFIPGFWDTTGWGFGVSVVTHRTGLADTVGRYGWDGGFGTSWRNDPAEDMVVIVLTQRMMGGADDTQLAEDVLTLAYQAIDD